MKKLLSILSVAIIGASSGSLVANDIEIGQTNETYAKEFFWNARNVPEIWNLKTQGHGLWTENPQMARALYTVNLGTESNVKTFTFFDDPIANVIWGNKEMGRWLPQKSFAVTLDEAHNKKITNIDDANFFPNLKIQLFDETYKAVFASLIARTYIGYTWYSENGQYYFQFLLFEYINIKNDYSAGYTQINLGTKFILS